MKDIKNSIAFCIVLIFTIGEGYSQSLEREIERYTTYQTLGLIGFCAGAIVTGIGIQNYTSKPILKDYEWEVYPGQNVETTFEDRSKIDLGYKEMCIAIPVTLICAYMTIDSAIRIHKLKRRLTLQYTNNKVEVSYNF